MAEQLRQSIAYRLLFAVLMISLLITLSTAGVRLYFDYRDAISSLEDGFREIEKTQLQSVTASLWVMDKELLQSHVNGIVNIGHVKYAGIQYKDQLIVSAGAPPAKQAVHREFPLYFTHNNRQVYIGSLFISASLKEIYDGLQSSLLRVLVYQGVQVFLISLFIFFFFQLRVTKHLVTMAAYFKKQAPWVSDSPLLLAGYASADADKDELGQVAAAINTMSANMRHAFHELDTELQKRKQAEASLQLFRKLTDQSSDAIFVIDPATSRFLDISEKACSSLGYMRDELLSLGAVDIAATIPDDVSWKARVDEVKNRGYMVLEERHKRKNGTSFPVEVNVTYIEVENRGYMLAVARDITERKNAEAALQEKEFLLSESQRISHIGSWSWDMASSRIAWSPEAYRVYGVSPETFVPTVESLFSLIHPDDRAAMQAWIGSCAKAEKPGDLEFRAIHPDGTVRIMNGRGDLQYDAENRPVRMMGTVQDITERIQAEEARRRSEALYHDLVETSQDLIWQCDAEGRYTYLNPAWEGVFGYQVEEMLGRKFSDFQTPEYAERDMKEFSRLMKGNTVKGFETVHLGKDGREIHLAFNAKFLIDEQGKLAGTRGTAYDITDRKKAEEEIKKSEAQFRSIIEASPVPFALNDEQQNITLLNRAFIQTFGYTLEDIPTLADWWPKAYPDPEYRQWVATTWQARLEKAKQEGKEFEPMELNIQCKNGTVLTVMASAASMQKSFLGEHLVILYDITKRKQAEQELEKYRENLEVLVKERTAALQDSQRALVNIVEDLNDKTRELEAANEKLQELDRLKSMFIASMSHELRTPLNSIIGFTGIILQGMTGEITEEQRDQLQRVSRSGKHLLALITDVIDISKIEAGKIDVYEEEFPLDKLLNEAASNLKTQINDKGLELEVSMVPPGIVMKTDRKRLFQSVLNYLSNAVKFTEKGKISLVAEEKDDMIDIKVMDTGIGIKEEDIPRLFQSFVRLDSPLTVATTGTGLGLYLTRKLVTEVLGGTVSVTSKQGKGSTFSLRIPKELIKTEVENVRS